MTQDQGNLDETEHRGHQVLSVISENVRVLFSRNVRRAARGEPQTCAQFFAGDSVRGRTAPLQPGRAAHVGLRAERQSSRSVARTPSIQGGSAMIMRITWGKLRPGSWSEFEKAYNATVATKGRTIKGLRG